MMRKKTSEGKNTKNILVKLDEAQYSTESTGVKGAVQNVFKCTSKGTSGQGPVLNLNIKRLSPIVVESEVLPPTQKRKKLRAVMKVELPSTSNLQQSETGVCTPTQLYSEENIDKCYTSQWKHCSKISDKNGISDGVKRTENEKEKVLMRDVQNLKNEVKVKAGLIDENAADIANYEVVISSMKEEFTCVICNELFIKPYSLVCSHLFCEFCIKKWINSKHMECPICRVKITTQPVFSPILNNAVSKLETKLNEHELEERAKLIEDRKTQVQAMSSISLPSALSAACFYENTVSSESESDESTSGTELFECSDDDTADIEDYSSDANSNYSSSSSHDASTSDIGSSVSNSSSSNINHISPINVSIISELDSNVTSDTESSRSLVSSDETQSDFSFSDNKGSSDSRYYSCSEGDSDV